MTGPLSGPTGRGDSAILRPSAAAQHIDVRRVAPCARLSDLTEYHWIVRWECPEPYEQRVIVQPTVHVSAEWRDGEPRLLVNGITHERFARRLEGRGHVLGTAFTPAGFHPVLGSTVSALTGRVVALGDLVGPDDRPAAAAVLATEATDEAMVDALEGHLGRLETRPDPLVAELDAVVRAAEHDRSITRAEQLAAHAGIGLRTLQRQFTEYLGIGPKWVVQRFRLLDAAAAAHAGEATDWAALAADLGFSDQSHLIRVFTAVVGTPPSAYQRNA